MTLSIRLLFAAMLLLLLLLPAAPAAAGSPSKPWFGRWLIAEARPAPWSVSGDPGSAPHDAGLIGKTITYARNRITAPRLLGCARPRYRWLRVPVEGLFQGGLTAPATQAAALGFSGREIETLDTGCPDDIAIHFVDRTTALFALDNMVYTLRRQR